MELNLFLLERDLSDKEEKARNNTATPAMPPSPTSQREQLANNIEVASVHPLRFPSLPDIFLGTRRSSEGAIDVSQLQRRGTDGFSQDYFSQSPPRLGPRRVSEPVIEGHPLLARRASLPTMMIPPAIVRPPVPPIKMDPQQRA